MNGNPKQSHGIWMHLAQFLQIHVCCRTKFPKEHDRRIFQVLLHKKSMAGLAAVISFTASLIASSFRSYKIVTCTVRAALWPVDKNQARDWWHSLMTRTFLDILRVFGPPNVFFFLFLFFNSSGIQRSGVMRFGSCVLSNMLNDVFSWLCLHLHHIYIKFTWFWDASGTWSSPHWSGYLWIF